MVVGMRDKQCHVLSATIAKHPSMMYTGVDSEDQCKNVTCWFCKVNTKIVRITMFM